MKYFNKIVNKYRNMSVEMKAAAWYAVGNIIQKFAPWFVMIILTHYLVIEQYGVYSIYMSWLEIFEIIITLRIYSNGYVAGLVKDDNNRNTYTATIQSLGIILITIWSIIYLIFHRYINNVTEISTSLSILMFCSFISTTTFGIWSSRQRVNNKYKEIIIAIVIYGLIGPVVGALTVFLDLNNPIFYVIATRTAIQLIVSIPFFLSNYKGSSAKYQKEIAIDTIKYNLPLVPYYLSMILLNHSDRLMIQKINGYASAALYSVSYSSAMIIFIISGALNLSLQAWLFKELKKKENSTDKSKLITMGTVIISFCAIVEIIMAPEIILLFGGKKYLDAVWVMPPLTVSVVVMYIYQQYVNVLFYYKKTKFLLFTSVFAAVCNIILNAIFIPIYGFIAAGYTSLISYLIVMVLYFVFARKECKINEIKINNYFNTKLQMTILIITITIAFLALLLYKNTIMRYSLVIIIFVFLFLTRKKWLSELRGGRRHD